MVPVKHMDVMAHTNAMCRSGAGVYLAKSAARWQAPTHPAAGFGLASCSDVALL